MSTISTAARNSNLTVAIAVATTIIVVFAFLAAPSLVAPQLAPIPVTGSQDVNSATSSYIAWAETADSERAVVDSATRSYTSWARSLDAVDSATRSYIAWAQYLLRAPAK